MEGRKRVKHYKSLSCQPALVLCCFAEVSLWWKVFRWHKTLAAEVTRFCCRNLVLASESQWARQFWEQRWPASVPPHALLVHESVLQEWWKGFHWEMHQIRTNWHYLPVATLKGLSEARWAVPDIVMLFIMESSTRTMLMDHYNQIWAFRVDVVLPFFSSRRFLNALNLYMSILWLNAWVVRRRYSKPVAPVPFHATNQTCHLVNNILCCKKSASC